MYDEANSLLVLAMVIQTFVNRNVAYILFWPSLVISLISPWEWFMYWYAVIGCAYYLLENSHRKKELK